jgi:hypothetical protein
MQGLSKLGTPGKLGSFAGPAVEADALYVQLVEQGQAALAAAQEKLAGNDKFEGVLGVLAANRVYGNLAELKKDLISAEREIGKDKSLAETLKQAEALDRALALAGNKTTASKAPAALELVMTRFPGTPAAKLAQAKLGELSSEVQDSDAKPADGDAPVAATALRTWSDATGAFQVEAELVKVADGKVELKKRDGQTLTVPIDRLSQGDQAFLAKRK